MIATGRIAEVRKLLREVRADGKRIGFVPTMGALHAGHRSLIKRAADENEFVVVSIFVNPTQFAPNEDLSKYPRTFADDLDACKDEGANLVFHPDAGEMYPEASKTQVTVTDLTEPMEGEVRPGHFGGVALVCAKLFNIVGECRAYFGDKDAQQLRVVARMVNDLSMPVEIVRCPTIREDDGLAMSSRNRYLDQQQRATARSLSQALRAILEQANAGTTDVPELEAAGRDVLERAGVDAIDYLDVVDADSLEHLERLNGRPALVCGAVRIGNTRLIDNMQVGENR